MVLEKMTKHEWEQFDHYFSAGVNKYNLKKIADLEVLQQILKKIKQLKP